jgi:hypothetical protein
MAYGDAIIDTMREYCTAHPDEPAFPQAFVNKLLETNDRAARQYAQKKEREELVCRLLASGMPIDEISIILKIRKEEISLIESENAGVRIPDYAKKLAARRKSRERR